MYRRNLQITIGKFSGKPNNPVRIEPIKSSTPISATPGGATLLTLFIILPLLFLSGCDTSGSVGGEILPDEDLIHTIQIDLDDLALIHSEAYSGSLRFTSLGAVDDPVYGSMKSTALLKPSLSSSTVDTLTGEDTLLLQLIFDARVYGDDSSVSVFDIYEAGEIWRGSQLRYNETVDVNYSNRIATISVAASDTTAMVELNESWKLKFAEYFNSSEAESDSLYRQNFPGLAIVPAEGTTSMRFLKNQQQSSEEVITSLIVRSPAQDEENGENSDSEEEDEEEETEPTIYFRDWAASVEKSGSPETDDHLVLYNTSHVLRVNPDFSQPDVDLSSKNIVNAQLLLYKNREPEKAASHISRLTSTAIRAHIFPEEPEEPEEPEDIMARIFTSNPRYQAVAEEDEDLFSMDITEFTLNQVFGEENTQELYITLQDVNGLFYANHFYHLTDPERKPKIIITTVE